MPATTADVLAFHTHWDVLGLVAFLALGYWYGIKRLAPTHAPRGEEAVTRRQQVYYYSGVAALLVVRGWPVHDIGEGSLFSFHMIEHMAMAVVIPPLLLLGTPWWLLRMVVRPVLPALRILTKPVVALVLFNAVLAGLHAVSVVELMVTNEAFHFFAHAALLVAAVLMWWPVIGPIPDLPRLAPFHRMGYLFLQSLVPTIPASFMTLASTPIYPFYADFPRLWGLDATNDQIIAGFIMKFGGGAILWGAIAITFFMWFAEEERLEKLLAAGR
jgi:putative membrane protein